MKAYTRNGQEIKVGGEYMFAEVGTGRNIVRKVIEIIDADAVRINDCWHSTRWACNALFEVRR